MAGFLTHLVQRTLAASPVLAPRLSGRYEGPREASESPLPSDAAAVSGTPVRVQGPASTQAESPAMPGPREARARHARMMDPNDLEQVSEIMPMRIGATLLEPPEVAVMPRLDVPPPTPRPARHDGAPHVQDPPAPQAAAEAPARGTRTSVQDVAPFQPSSPQPQPHEVEARALQPVVSTNARPAPASDVNASRSSVVPSVDASPQPQPRGAQTGMLVEPRLPGDSDHQRQPAQAPAAPTVHVTIGRIELRAAAPAAAPAPSRNAGKAPALSLSDYLERRAKAGSG